MRTGNLSTWLLRGTYPRLYVPILLIIALVTGVRYHLLVATETAEVRRHAAAELRRVADALLPTLSSLPAEDTESQAARLQEALARLGPGIQALTWQVGNRPAMDAVAPSVPATRQCSRRYPFRSRSFEYVEQCNRPRRCRHVMHAHHRGAVLK